MEMQHGPGLAIAKASHRVQLLSNLIATTPTSAPAATALAITSGIIVAAADRHALRDVAACARDISSSVTRPMEPPAIVQLAELSERLNQEVQRLIATPVGGS